MKAFLSGLLLATVACGTAGADNGTATSPAAAATDNWPQWRGPNLDGTADATGLPTTWSEEKNVKWKVKLPAMSGSTPIIWDDKIFVASGSPAGTGGRAELKRGMGGFKPPSAEGGDLWVLCLSKKDGKELWHARTGGGNYYHGRQNMSSPSPVTDGEILCTLTGTGVVTGFTLDGKQVWQVDLQKSYGRFGLNWSYGSSPLLYEGMVIVPVLHGMLTDDPSYLVAFDIRSGKVIWRVERPTDAEKESPDAYTTPVPMKVGNRTEIIVFGGDYFTGHDPKTGREIWRCGGVNPRNDGFYRTVTSPAIVGNMIFGCVKKGPVVACRGGGRGNVTKTHIAWTNPNAYDVPTPVSDGKYLYVLHDRGMMSCYDPATGKALYEKERIAKGPYDASPLLADGKIYVTNHKADTTVLAAGPKFKVLAENELDGRWTMSSVAVSGKNLFIRTESHLYCIGE